MGLRQEHLRQLLYLLPNDWSCLSCTLKSGSTSTITWTKHWCLHCCRQSSIMPWSGNVSASLANMAKVFLATRQLDFPHSTCDAQQFLNSSYNKLDLCLNLYIYAALLLLPPSTSASHWIPLPSDWSPSATIASQPPRWKDARGKSEVRRLEARKHSDQYRLSSDYNLIDRNPAWDTIPDGWENDSRRSEAALNFAWRLWSETHATQRNPKHERSIRTYRSELAVEASSVQCTRKWSLQWNRLKASRRYSYTNFFY